MQRPVHDHLQIMAGQQNGVQERKGSSTSQQAYISQGIFILNFFSLSPPPFFLPAFLFLRSWLFFWCFQRWKKLFINRLGSEQKILEILSGYFYHLGYFRIDLPFLEY